MKRGYVATFCTAEGTYSMLYQKCGDWEYP